jgi:hypothetical protein
VVLFVVRRPTKFSPLQKGASRATCTDITIATNRNRTTKATTPTTPKETHNSETAVTE